MIHYAFRTTGSGRIEEGVADRIRVCYTPTAIQIKVLVGTNEYIYTLSSDWNEDTISEFRCDKFALRA